MKYIADLHIHSKYARACSKSLVPENLAYWAQIKGVDILGTGDFTHPAWFKELKEKLQPAETGLFTVKTGLEPSEKNAFPITSADYTKTRFLLQTELSCIYKKGNATRRLHMLIFAPSFEAVEKINSALIKRGCNLASDGRAIIGMDAKELTKIALESDERCMIVPAHAWTPWFAVFGSKSGFDSLQECFDELTPYIYAIETGLSSDPTMNHQVSALDNITLLSNSDAHSCSNLAREANVFDLPELTYDAVCNAIKENDAKKFLYTIEFYPEEGMYHIDGHRDCHFSCEPDESKRLKNMCPVCHKPLTIGVLNRVQQLADREYGFLPKHVPAHKSIVGLDDILAEALQVKGRKSKKVLGEYKKLIETVGNELHILLDADLNKLKGNIDPNILEGLSRNREGKLFIEPGFDGQYGKVKVFQESELLGAKQKVLFV